MGEVDQIKLPLGEVESLGFLRNHCHVGKVHVHVEVSPQGGKLIGVWFKSERYEIFVACIRSRKPAPTLRFLYSLPLPGALGAWTLLKSEI